VAKHPVRSRKQWLAARLELLEQEKELRRRRDELIRQRQDLPWIWIDKNYGLAAERRCRVTEGALAGSPPRAARTQPRTFGSGSGASLSKRLSARRSGRRAS
jgi:uncharacterized protein DUF899